MPVRNSGALPRRGLTFLGLAASLRAGTAPSAATMPIPTSLASPAVFEGYFLVTLEPILRPGDWECVVVEHVRLSAESLQPTLPIPPEPLVQGREYPTAQAGDAST